MESRRDGDFAIEISFFQLAGSDLIEIFEDYDSILRQTKAFMGHQ